MERMHADGDGCGRAWKLLNNACFGNATGMH